MLEETLNALGLSSSKHKQINLALQGGGAHGAFTWGVLDRLLEDDYMSFDTLSGTSAGAINAVALTQGYLENGQEGARKKLAEVWRDISKAGDWTSIPQSPADMMSKAMNGFFSSFNSATLEYDPLRNILENHIDFERIRSESPFGLYIAATQVSNGNAHIFTTTELTVDSVLASACLPFLSKSIVIDGEPYWDGGFSANPAIRPVIYNSNTNDTLLIQLSSLNHFQLPSHIGNVRTHLNHLNFSQSLRREIELIEAGREVTKFGVTLNDKARRLARHHFHLIDGSEVTSKQSPGSELTPEWNLLQTLFEEGRAYCDVFLHESRDKIGHCSSIDLKEHFDL